MADAPSPTGAIDGARLEVAAMLFSLWLPLVLQVIVPLALLGWLAWSRHASRATWASAVVLVVTYIVSVAIGGLWLVLPWYLPYGYLALALAAAARSWRVARCAPLLPVPRRTQMLLVATLAGALVLLTMGGTMIAARTPDVAPLDLASPLRGPAYVVVNGGHSTLINAHLATLSQPRYRAYRGQSHGIDVVKLGALGVRAWGLLPADPAAYAIFGDPVYAPCAGEVVSTLNTAPDMPPPTPDRQHMAGNHVILACGGAWVVLGHFRQGSVSVTAGDWVGAGAHVGVVGNSGNSNEPHLHVHAQTPGTRDMPFGGRPIPIRIDGRDLVRNARLR